jgi:hypothetical protein
MASAASSTAPVRQRGSWPLKYVLADENASRYEPFGLVISKSYAYQHDCRPVCYLSDSEAEEMQVPVSQ